MVGDRPATGIKFGVTRDRLAAPAGKASNTTAMPEDGRGTSVEATTRWKPEVSSTAAPAGKSLGTKLALAALGVTSLVGGLGMLPGTAAPAQASEVYMQCTSDPWQSQDTQQLNHMATLFASPLTGFNRAAGLYDADTNFLGIPNSASELTRLDGNQALKQLSCGHPVRFYSPQTGWLKFHDLDELHGYQSTYSQDGEMPWDMPGVYLGESYTARYGSPYYDSDFYRYNDYNAFAAGFYAGLSQPTWTYVAPPVYTPPSQWSTSAPSDPFAPGRNAPADPFQGRPSTSAPSDPFRHGAPATTTAPTDPFRHGSPNGTNAPSDPFHGVTPRTNNAPYDPFAAGHVGHGNVAPDVFRNTPPVHNTAPDPFRYAPPARTAPTGDPFHSSGQFNPGGGSISHGGAGGSAPRDPFHR